MRKGVFLFSLFLLFFSVGVLGEIKWSEDSSTDFSVSSQGYSCVDDGNYWLTYSGGKEVKISTDGNCSLREALGEDSPTCCPYNSKCDLSTGKCNSSITLSRCRDYVDEDSCNNYNSKIGIFSVEEITKEKGFCSRFVTLPDSCVQKMDCFCEWNSSSNECFASYSTLTKCPPGPNPIPPKPEKEGNCTFSMEIKDDCNNSGVYSVSTRAFWEGDASAIGFDKCKDSSFSVPCGDYLKLPFFARDVFLVAFSLIFFVYFVFYLRKKFS